jgi:hypothetical protein
MRKLVAATRGRWKNGPYYAVRLKPGVYLIRRNADIVSHIAVPNSILVLHTKRYAYGVTVRPYADNTYVGPSATFPGMSPLQAISDWLWQSGY